EVPFTLTGSRPTRSLLPPCFGSPTIHIRCPFALRRSASPRPPHLDHHSIHRPRPPSAVYQLDLGLFRRCPGQDFCAHDFLSGFLIAGRTTTKDPFDPGTAPLTRIIFSDSRTCMTCKFCTVTRSSPTCPGMPIFFPLRPGVERLPMAPFRRCVLEP